MAIFTGTDYSEEISTTNVSSTVTADPFGSKPSNSSDIIFGGGGNDTIRSGGGNDYLNGGTGKDYMAGGTGNDTYIVDDVNDTVFEAAGEGTDTVHAFINYTLPNNVENLYLVGPAINGTGNSLDNKIYGNNQNNFLYGLDGKDTLYGGAGADNLYGDNGTDTLYGGIGDDKLYGGNDNDTLYGEEGNDYLDGGAGKDTMRGGPGNDEYVVENSGDSVYEAVDAGRDKVNAYIDYTLPSNVEDLYLQGAAIKGTGNNLANNISGNNNDNILSGKGGVDFIYGKDGNDTIYGGDGNDYISGGNGNDKLYGENGMDELYGGDGNDFLYGGSGIDQMSGGSGNDTYEVKDTGDQVIEASNAGTDRVNAYVDYTLPANVENLYLYSPATKGTGNSLDNIIYGTSNNDNLSGLGGNDTLWGHNGNDVLSGGSGNDDLEGGAGNDHLYGDSGDDYLYGSDGDDTLYGGSGKDKLNGGSGNDSMSGGDGDDVYIVQQSGDTVSEAVNNGIDDVQAYVNFTLSSNVENLYLYGAATHGTGNSLNNMIIGNDKDNTLSGLGGNDKLVGMNGNDTLYGGDGNDILDGWNGNDSLSGQAGNDSLYGNMGQDTLTGGGGEDRFYFSHTGLANRDTIVDFSHADDTIVLMDKLDGVADNKIKGLTFDASNVLSPGSYFEGPNKTGNGTTDPSGIYNDTTTGIIWYNPTGNIGNDAQQICLVGVSTAPSLDHTDFVYSG